MNSILNSISQGDLQVLDVPRETPIKTDSIIDLLQNSEIEFNTCPKLEDSTKDFNTGFGENNDLHFDSQCQKPKLKTPLYQENCLSEFTTEEEKAAARHSLGLYNKNDVVAMSLLTAEDTLPSQQSWKDATIKQMRKGDQFFTPLTQFKAVYDSDGNTLDVRFKEVNRLISNQQKELLKITQVSNLTKISSLGDVTTFLQGFNNGDNLRQTLDAMNQEMLRFETTGQITM